MTIVGRGHGRLQRSHVALVVGLLASGAWAQLPQPRVLSPQTLAWSSPPNNPGVRGAWLLGDEQAAAPYVFRVVLASDARLAVHTHNDTRVTTVMAGTLYVGFGTRYDEAKMVAVPAGAAYVAPAGVPHFLWAREGEVSYQESGVGPTATIPFSP